MPGQGSQPHAEVPASPDGTFGQVPQPGVDQASTVTEAGNITPEQWGELAVATEAVIGRAMQMHDAIDATDAPGDSIESSGGFVRHEYRNPEMAEDDPNAWVKRDISRDSIIKRQQSRAGGRPVLVISKNKDGSMTGDITNDSGPVLQLTDAQAYRAAERIVSDVADTLERKHLEYEESQRPPQASDEQLDAFLNT